MGRIDVQQSGRQHRLVIGCEEMKVPLCRVNRPHQIAPVREEHNGARLQAHAKSGLYPKDDQ
jgi:hypothetical protein